MSDEIPQVTLREQLAEAIESAPEIETPAATAVADSRARAEDGKFAKAEKPAEAPETPQEPEKVERPSTWKKEHWERFDKLEPDLKKYILQRENEYKAGLSTYNGEVKAAQSLKQAIEPFMPELQRHNIDPGQWIKSLGTAHHTLALGNPQQKLQMFAKLATDYGVDLRQLGAGQSAPEFQAIAQNLQGLQQEWNQFRTQQQMAEQAAIQQTIQAFGADTEKHPHFEAVRGKMAGLLQSGLAQDLEDAYEQAVYSSRDIREQLLTAQQQSAKAANLEAQAAIARKARANAVSPRSAAPGAQVSAKPTKGLRETLSEQLDAMSSRV